MYIYLQKTINVQLTQHHFPAFSSILFASFYFSITSDLLLSFISNTHTVKSYKVYDISALKSLECAGVHCASVHVLGPTDAGGRENSKL